MSRVQQAHLGTEKDGEILTGEALLGALPVPMDYYAPDWDKPILVELDGEVAIQSAWRGEIKHDVRQIWNDLSDVKRAELAAQAADHFKDKVFEEYHRNPNKSNG